MNIPTKQALLLTDSGTVNLMLKGTLQSHGYAVTIVQSEKGDCFETLLTLRPDIIFLRTELKHGNGLEVCDRIRKEPLLEKTRIVFLSSNPMVRDQAIEHRADRFLTMPFAASDVQETLRFFDSITRQVVLYVDDSPLLHAAVVPHLKDEGFEILEAFDGREAMELIDARDGRIDLIISDVEMPVMDGISLCKTLRATRSEDIPFVLLTSLDTPEAVSRGFEAGADDYVTKPVLVPELLSRVKRLLQSSGGRQESKRPEQILVVDDSPVIRGMILTALRSHGFVADTADHGLAALAKLKVKRYHLLVTDYDMPHMNGLELCTKIRQEVSTIQQIPIIFVTARDAKSDEVRVKSLGVQAFLTKPFQADRFLSETERVLSLGRLERQNRMLSYYFPEQSTSWTHHADGAEKIIAGAQFRTILFAGLADFRALTKRLDAKALLVLLNRYFSCMLEVLNSHNIQVDKILEDRLIVSFANQDQGAMQAIECARALHNAISNLQRQTGLDVRLQTGIHSGHLVLGVLEPLPQHCGRITLIGESIDLARRVKEVAISGEIVLSETTFALVQTLITTKPMGFIKTQDDTMRVFQVLD
ncbi:MAG: response regulator [Magnetococcales bacterium]|nr:response regulator [Magnetococcales bacterium]